MRWFFFLDESSLSCNEYQYLRGQVVLPASPDNTSLTMRLASWLSRIQNQGFSAESLRAFIDETNDGGCNNDNHVWWQDDLVRVFDPYHDLSEPGLVESVLDGKSVLSAIYTYNKNQIAFSFYDHHAQTAGPSFK